MNSKRQRLNLLYRDKVKSWAVIINGHEYHAGFTVCATGLWSPDRHYVFNDDTHVQIYTWLLIAKRLYIPKDIVLFICKYIPVDQTYVKLQYNFLYSIDDNVSLVFIQSQIELFLTCTTKYCNQWCNGVYIFPGL